MKNTSTSEPINSYANNLAPLTAIQAVQEAAMIAMDSEDVSQLARDMLSLIRRIFSLDSFYFIVCNSETGFWMKMIQADTIDGELRIWDEEDLAPQYGNPIKKQVFEGHPRLLLRNPQDTVQTDFSPFGDVTRRSESLMFVPMLYHGKGRGLLSVQSYQPNAYTQKDLELLEAIASIIGGALPRIQAEKTLQKSEAIYRMAIENISGVPYRLHYENSHYEFIGRGLEKLFGIPAEDFSYSRFQQIVKEIVVIDPDVSSDAYEYGKAYRRGEYSHFRVDLRIETPQGEEKWVSDSAVPYIDENTGEVVGSLGIMVDITDRKQADKALRESELRYRQLVESTPDLIAICQNETFVFINPAGARLIGAASPEQVIGRSLLDFVAPATRADFSKHLQRILQGEEKSSSIEEKLLRLDGCIIDIEILPIAFQVNGNPALQILARSITDRKALESERLKIQKLESTGLLAGGIAHDFNNSLTAIMGNLSLARLAECLNDETRYILDQVLEACLRARDLTHQLLTFSKGGSPIKRTTSISEIIRESVQFALRGSSIRPEFTFPDQLWSVDADEGQLNQVINNLAINAQQAMPEGGVVHFYAENKQLERSSGLPLEPGRYVMVAVRDQGVGIPSKYLERIFDPYFSTKQKGSGLGLAIAHSIIQKHGGNISVDSEVGKGSTFCIYLPASTEPTRKNRNTTGTLDFGSGRILVMDDEEMIRFLATKMLKHLGYETTTVPDGQEALTVYQDALQKGTPFDAVIVDLTVPGGMGGKKTVQHLKEIDPEVKCIVSSGYSDDPIMAEYHRYGFSAVIAKPYTIAHMGETLASVLNHK